MSNIYRQSESVDDLGGVLTRATGRSLIGCAALFAIRSRTKCVCRRNGKGAQREIRLWLDSCGVTSSVMCSAQFKLTVLQFSDFN